MRVPETPGTSMYRPESYHDARQRGKCRFRRSFLRHFGSGKMSGVSSSATRSPHALPWGAVLAAAGVSALGIAHVVYMRVMYDDAFIT
jgi:hypothetical protein